MLSLLKNQKIANWCLFDFAISAYPTLIITFFYGAFYAKKIAKDPIIGTSLWGYAMSSASIFCFLFFGFFLIYGRNFFKKISNRFFSIFFYLLVLFTFLLFIFDENSNQFSPLLFIVVTYVCFEYVNLFYNVSLFKVKKKHFEGAISNLGWAFGYLGGLLSLLIVFIFLQKTKNQGYEFLGFPILLYIGPFVAVWTLVFGFRHIETAKPLSFEVPNIAQLFDNIRASSLQGFIISYLFFNNAVVAIFSFASMFAAFLFNLSESQILLLGVFINLSGIFGCIVLGNYEDKVGSMKIVYFCILSLLSITFTLFFIKSVILFWILALLIGFFVGPIQASSRSLLVKLIKSSNQLSIFTVYSMLGNLCSILGPFLVGLVIDLSGSIRIGLLTIPLFFMLSLLPGLFNLNKR